MKSRCVLCAHAFSHHREIKDPELRRAFPQHTPSSLPSDWLTFPRNSTLQRGSSSRKMVVHNASERERKYRNEAPRPLVKMEKNNHRPPVLFSSLSFLSKRRVRILPEASSLQIDVTGGLFGAGLFHNKRRSSTGHILKSLSKPDFSHPSMRWPVWETDLFLRVPLGATKVRRSCFGLNKTECPV